MTKAQRVIHLVEQENDSDNVIPAMDIPEEETLIIKIVDDTKVRDEYDIEFTMDGHHYRYDFIPDNELWLGRMNKEDIIATEVHAFSERIMQKYYGIDYDIAHEQIGDACEKVIRDFIRSHRLANGDEDE